MEPGAADAFGRWAAASFLCMLGTPARKFEPWDDCWRCIATGVFGAVPMHVELRFLVPTACVQFIVAARGRGNGPDGDTDTLTEAMIAAAGKAVGDACGCEVVVDRLSKRAVSVVVCAR